MSLLRRQQLVDFVQVESWSFSWAPACFRQWSWSGLGRRYQTLMPKKPLWDIPLQSFLASPGKPGQNKNAIVVSFIKPGSDCRGQILSWLTQVGWCKCCLGKVSVSATRSECLGLTEWQKKDAHLDKPNNCAVVMVSLDCLEGTSGSCSESWIWHLSFWNPLLPNL